MSEEDSKLVDNAAAKLGEHFDSVRIFVTRYIGMKTQTECYTAGLGNIYSQIGFVNEWKARQDQYVRESAKKDE